MIIVEVFESYMITSYQYVSVVLNVNKMLNQRASISSIDERYNLNIVHRLFPVSVILTVSKKKCAKR